MKTEALRERYLQVRKLLVEHPDILVEIEEIVSRRLCQIIRDGRGEIKADYDAASKLFPFWRSNPPLERGRMPKGDQFPWIEVGENAVGNWIIMNMAKYYNVSNPAFPTGPDQRIVISGPSIRDASSGLTDSVWLMMDIKSAGPRDDADHAVMSRNQVSGSGEWLSEKEWVTNSPLQAVGARKVDEFFPSLPPLVILNNGKALPVITMAIKTVYSMSSVGASLDEWSGQPLSRVDVATIPNGLLLSCNPGYAMSHKGILFPGKDDKSVVSNRRARVSFGKLREISSWRHENVLEF